MKKLFLVSIIVFGVFTTANAQFYAGAGLGIGLSNYLPSSDSQSPSSSYFALNLLPEFGYIITPKISLGVNLGVNLGINTSEYNGLSNDYVTSTSSYEFAPYARFSVVRYKGFALQAQGDVFVSGSKSTTTYNDITNTNESYLNFGLRVAPRLSYDISKHFTLFTKLNFLSLRFITSVDNNTKDVRTNFNLSGNTSNIINLDGLSIGMLYVF